MKQQTFTDLEYAGRKRKTKREEFLEIMDEITPWEEMCRQNEYRSYHCDSHL